MTAETRSEASCPLTKSNDAALRGASLAFGKPPVKPKPNVNSTSCVNALAAATKANGVPSIPPSRTTSTSRREAEEHTLAYQRTGSSNASGSAGDLDRIQQRLRHLERGGNGFLQLPSPDQSQSPSLIAATLAASRSASVTPNHTGQRQSSAAATLKKQKSFTRLSPGWSPGSAGLSAGESEDRLLDTRSILPTTSLIGMFEQNATPRLKKSPALRKAATSATAKPNSSSETTIPARTRSPEPPHTKSSKLPETKSPKPPIAPPILTLSKQNEVPKDLVPAQKALLPISNPIPIPFTSRSLQAQSNEDGASSDDSFVSASEYKPSWRAALQNQNRRLTSNSLPSINTVDALANAIVASSLASSRAASPLKSFQSSTIYPAPPPPRRSPHKHLFHSKETSRTPSPAKQSVLRMTMRKPKADDDVDEGEVRRKRKALLMKKHPNKHHEGDRKRWRDEVTERERKRYEAVWASNKGLHTPPGLGGSVCNLVVRDVFSRSRLHTDVLEEVYALVDRKQSGCLDRDEFMVGLWLIDQRLKGRKLPIRVSDSVWKSVGALGGMGGIKIRQLGK